MRLISQIIGLYPYFQILTKFLRNWCIIEWLALLICILFYLGYPGYQRLFLACDEEPDRLQANTTSAEGPRHQDLTETRNRAWKASGTQGTVGLSSGSFYPSCDHWYCRTKLFRETWIDVCSPEVSLEAHPWYLKWSFQPWGEWSSPPLFMAATGLAGNSPALYLFQLLCFIMPVNRHKT